MTSTLKTWAMTMQFEYWGTLCTNQGKQHHCHTCIFFNSTLKMVAEALLCVNCVILVSVFNTRPITLTVAKCWDPNPRSCFALPRSEFVSFCSFLFYFPMCCSVLSKITNSNCFSYISFNRRANPTHWPSCVGVPHGGDDWGIPSIWHESFYEHRHLHQLLHQQFHPWDWKWVTSPPAAACCGLLSSDLSDSKWFQVTLRHCFQFTFILSPCSLIAQILPPLWICSVLLYTLF